VAQVFGTHRSIAAHLDGMPLALELAAAWVRTLTPYQVEAGLDDRFSLLVRGLRGVQRRQRTLAGSIDWSHALLDEIDRIVFRRLAVFAGTFGLAAARALCAGGTVTAAEVLPALGRLVDKSLVVAEVRAGGSRYRLEYGNLRAALEWGLAEGEPDAGRGAGGVAGVALASRSPRPGGTPPARSTSSTTQPRERPDWPPMPAMKGCARCA
jgi:predicted ATPase